MHLKNANGQPTRSTPGSIMEAYAIASATCAACFAGLLAVVFFYARSLRRNRQLEAALSAEKCNLSELIAENLTLSERLARLTGIEIEFFSLRREHARVGSNLQHLCRVETGLRGEIDRLTERLARLDSENLALRQTIGPDAFFPAEQQLRQSA